MCKYCDLDKFGESIHSIGELRQTIEINGIELFLVDTHIVKEGADWELNSFMCTFGYDEGCTSKSINIKFCPFCGRKLD